MKNEFRSETVFYKTDPQLWPPKRQRSFSPNLICTIDRNGNLIQVSSTSGIVCGYKPFEVEGKKFTDFIGETDKLRSREFALQVMRGRGLKSFKLHCRQKNGSSVLLAWSVEWKQREKLFYCVARNATDIQTADKRQRLPETRLHRAYKLAHLAWWEYDVASQIFTVSDEIFQMFGLPPASDQRLTLADFLQSVYAEDRPRLQQDLGNLSENVYINYEHRVMKPSGEIITVRHYSEVIRDADGKSIAVVGAGREITEAKYYHQLEKLEREILAMNAAGKKTLKELLDHYMIGLESLHPGMICSVLKKTGDRLFNLSAPGLPADYCRLLEGITIGNNKGSCGTAAFLKQSVYVTDTQNDIRWEKIKEIAAKYQIGACLSQPIYDSTGEVVATFAGYYRTPKEPSRLERNTLERTGQFLRILLESHRKEEALRESNLRYELATMATNDAVFDWDAINDVLKWGEALYTSLGYRPGETLVNSRQVMKRIHPKDVRKVVEDISAACENGRINWSHRFRIQKADLSYAYVTGKATIIFNDRKEVVRIVGALRDMTEKIQQEKRLTFMAKATNEIIWEEKVNSDETYIDAEKLNKMFGYELTGNFVHHSFWRDKVHPQDATAMVMKRKQSVEEGLEYFIDDFRLRKQDGSWAYIRNRTYIVKDLDGKIISFMGAMDDITFKVRLQRKLVQEKVRHQQNITKAAIEAQEQERSEIGKELHDNVNQMLAAAKLYIQNIHHYPDQSIELARKSAALLQSSIDEIRKLSGALVSPIIRDMSFEDALLELLESYRELKIFELGHHFSFNEANIEAGIRLTVYRILQEQFNNTVKYANASRVQVVIRSTENNLILFYKDNGIGFDLSTTKQGLGLSNIRNRTNTYRGKMSITSSVGGGCQLKICFPLHQPGDLQPTI